MKRGLIILGVLVVIGVGALFFLQQRNNTTSAAAHAQDGDGLEHLIFVSRLGGSGDIYAMPMDGGEAVVISNDPDNQHHDVSPIVSPDGSRVIYQSSRESMRNGVYVIGIDGSDERELFGDFGGLANYAWSPDSAFIAYNDGFVPGPSHIFVVSVEGADAVNITSEEKYGGQALHWSPDGTMIAFDTYRDGSHAVYVMNADGSDARNLSNDAGWGAAYAVWSPDGTQIAFASEQTGNLQVFVTSREGGDPEQLTEGDVDHFPMFWTDAGIVYFSRAENATAGDLYLNPLDGGEPTLITSGVARIDAIALSPDGSELAYAVGEGRQALYRIPITGGEPTQIGTEDYFDVSGVQWGR